MQTDWLHSTGFLNRIEKHLKSFPCHIICLIQGIPAKQLPSYYHHDHTFSIRSPLSHLRAFNKQERFKREPQNTNEKQTGLSKEELHPSLCFPLNGLFMTCTSQSPWPPSSAAATSRRPPPNQNKIQLRFQQPSQARGELAPGDAYGHAGSIAASDQR